jgi:putative transposase
MLRYIKRKILSNYLNMAYEEYRASKKKRLLSRHERLRATAKALCLSKEANKRLEWIIYWEGRAGQNATLTARYFGIGRSTFHKWQSQFDETNLRTLESRSRAPKKRRYRKATPLKDQRIIDLRKRYPYWGKMKLKTLYEREFKEEITSWYIQRVIEHYKLYPKKRKKKAKTKRKTQVKKRISECEKLPKTGFLLHLDTIVLHLQGTKRYILTATDDHSKIGYARMYRSHASLPAKDFFERLYFLFDGQVVNVHTDNGSEFHKHFDKTLQELKLPHYWSRVKTPKDNPSNERFNRTLKEEFLYWGNFHPDPTIFNQRLTKWLVEYNAIRPHQSLNYLTPLEFAQKTKGLSTMWSSSTSH